MLAAALAGHFGFAARIPAASGTTPPSAAAPAAAPHPSILLVTLDTLRADHTSVYGYSRRTTPRLEDVARAGVVLELAYAPMATTTPSHATMFTALAPRSHGVTRNGHRLAADRVTLAEILARNGYRTGAVVSSYPLHREFGLAQGFATYDDHFEPGKGSKSKALGKAETVWEGIRVEGEFDRRGDDTRARAVAWLEQQGYLPPATQPTGAPPADVGSPGGAPPRAASASNAPADRPAPGAPAAGAPGQAAPATRPPFFLWVHFFDPHHPYDPPEEDAALFRPQSPSPTAIEQEIAAYDGDIHFADRQLGQLLDRMDAAGILDETLVVVVGDHGEGLLDHGWMFHGLMIYEEAVRVPLVLRWPRALPAGRRVATPAQLVDLAPTILDLAGLAERPPTTQGASIVPWLRGERPEDPERPVFVQRRSYDARVVEGRRVAGEKLAVRAGRWKYIEAREEDSFELYDLEQDPRELDNQHSRRPEEARRLAARLHEWRAGADATTPAANGSEAASQSVSEESARRLRALGYVQ